MKGGLSCNLKLSGPKPAISGQVEEDVDGMFFLYLYLNSYFYLYLMNITVKQSAKNSTRCQRSRAILNLITEHNSFSCYFKFHACSIIDMLDIIIDNLNKNTSMSKKQ